MVGLWITIYLKYTLRRRSTSRWVLPRAEELLSLRNQHLQRVYMRFLISSINLHLEVQGNCYHYTR